MVMTMKKVNWSLVKWMASLSGKVKGCLCDSQTGTHGCDSPHDDDDEDLKSKMVIIIFGIILFVCEFLNTEIAMCFYGRLQGDMMPRC